MVILGKAIIKNGTTPKIKIDAYHLDYSKKKYTNISFPKESVPDTDSTEVKVGDSFIYTREQESTTNTTGKK